MDSRQKNKIMLMLNKHKGQNGKRNKPLFWLHHKELHMKVPVISIHKEYVIWDGNQITREVPPAPAYEIAEWEEFIV